MSAKLMIVVRMNAGIAEAVIWQCASWIYSGDLGKPGWSTMDDERDVQPTIERLVKAATLLRVPVETAYFAPDEIAKIVARNAPATDQEAA